jgi:hypothetical protein
MDDSPFLTMRISSRALTSACSCGMYKGPLVAYCRSAILVMVGEFLLLTALDVSEVQSSDAPQDKASLLQRPDESRRAVVLDVVGA